MKNIAIITARGGSKRIPNKNIKDFLGQPIIAYSITAALESNIFSEVMVSTDSEEIAEIAIKYGAKVPFMRSQKNSDDYAITVDVLSEVVEEYEKRGMSFDAVCCIFPTAPFVTSKKLIDAFDLLNSTDTTTGVVTVTEFSYPPQRAFRIDEKGMLKFIFKENANKRSQEFDKLYHDCGQFYFLKTRALIEENALVPENSMPLFLSPLEMQDIDTIDDWNLAELKFKMMK